MPICNRKIVIMFIDGIKENKRVLTLVQRVFTPVRQVIALVQGTFTLQAPAGAFLSSLQLKYGLFGL